MPPGWAGARRRPTAAKPARAASGTSSAGGTSSRVRWARASGGRRSVRIGRVLGARVAPALPHSSPRLADRAALRRTDGGSWDLHGAGAADCWSMPIASCWPQVVRQLDLWRWTWLAAKREAVRTGRRHDGRRGAARPLRPAGIRAGRGAGRGAGAGIRRSQGSVAAPSGAPDAADRARVRFVEARPRAGRARRRARARSPPRGGCRRCRRMRRCMWVGSMRPCPRSWPGTPVRWRCCMSIATSSTSTRTRSSRCCAIGSFREP